MDFSKKLTNWYKLNERDFPWRKTKNPYFIWLSEIILQQTKTEQGLPYYISFTKHFPDLNSLAKQEEISILNLWQGLGYYSRARNLHFSAKHIVNNLDGKFPNNYKDLLKLKGVGDYTASAIASICYDEKCAVVDGNVYRVLSRYFGIETPINGSKGIKEFKQLAQSLLPNSNIGQYNQAIMDFGATICTPKKPKCETCFFNDSCYALQKNKTATLPIKTSKTKVKKRFFNYLVIITSDNLICLEERIKKDIWQHLYEFPLIESEHSITLKELINNPIFQALSKSIKQKEIYLHNTKPIIHKLSHQHIQTSFWIIKSESTTLNAINLNDLKDFPMPTLINNFIKNFKF